MEAILLICGIILLFLGYLPARSEYKRKLREQLATKQQEAYNLGFERGKEDALQDAAAVKKAYEYFYLVP